MEASADRQQYSFNVGQSQLITRVQVICIPHPLSGPPTQHRPLPGSSHVVEKDAEWDGLEPDALGKKKKSL